MKVTINQIILIILSGSFHLYINYIRDTFTIKYTIFLRPLSRNISEDLTIKLNISKNEIKHQLELLYGGYLRPCVRPDYWCITKKNTNNDIIVWIKDT